MSMRYDAFFFLGFEEKKKISLLSFFLRVAKFRISSLIAKENLPRKIRAVLYKRGDIVLGSNVSPSEGHTRPISHISFENIRPVCLQRIGKIIPTVARRAPACKCILLINAGGLTNTRRIRIRSRDSDWMRFVLLTYVRRLIYLTRRNGETRITCLACVHSVSLFSRNVRRDSTGRFSSLGLIAVRGEHLLFIAAKSFINTQERYTRYKVQGI